MASSKGRMIQFSPGWGRFSLTNLGFREHCLNREDGPKGGKRECNRVVGVRNAVSRTILLTKKKE